MSILNNNSSVILNMDLTSPYFYMGLDNLTIYLMLASHCFT